jgi:pilus assembly protein CpaF
MLPQRPPGPPAPTAGRTAGPALLTPTPSFESVKARVLSKLEDRLNPAASKRRMPSSLLRQSLRTHAEHIAEQEGGRLAKAERERLVDEVLAELLGYGPLDELFRDPAVREVMVAGPHAVLARRDTAGWLPTNVKFRDEAHLRSALDRLATHADPVGGVTASVSLFDLKLPNGFRAVAVIPPEALGRSAAVAFVREAAPAATPAETAEPPAGRPLSAPATGAAPAGTRPASPSGSVPALPKHPTPTAVTPSSRPAGRPVPPPLPPPLPAAAPAAPDPLELTQVAARDPLTRYRKPVMERLITKMAKHGVYDVQQVAITELRKIVAASITEYCDKEKIYLSDADQGRLMLEILTAMHR